MSGLYMQGPSNYNGFYIYIGYMLLYLVSLQSLLTAFTYLLPCDFVPAILAGLALWSGALSSGTPLSIKDLPIGAFWLRYVSPQAWLKPLLIRREYTTEAISAGVVTTLCRNKQVQHQDIIVQLPCPPPNGTQIMSNFGFLYDQQKIDYFGHPAFSLLAFYLIFFFITCFAFVLNCCNNKKRNKRHKHSNKP